MKIKLIYGQVVSDFQYNLTQCIFLSDTISYLRLDTKSSENDLIVLNHPDMQVIFTQFFDTVWNGECGEVLSSKEELIPLLSRFFIVFLFWKVSNRICTEKCMINTG